MNYTIKETRIGKTTGREILEISLKDVFGLDEYGITVYKPLGGTKELDEQNWFINDKGLLSTVARNTKKDKSAEFVEDFLQELCTYRYAKSENEEDEMGLFLTGYPKSLTLDNVIDCILYDIETIIAGIKEIE